MAQPSHISCSVSHGIWCLNMTEFLNISLKLLPQELYIKYAIVIFNTISSLKIILFLYLLILYIIKSQ